MTVLVKYLEGVRSKSPLPNPYRNSLTVSCG